MEGDIKKNDLTPRLNLPKKRQRRWLWLAGAVVLVLALAAGGVYYFYQDGLRPVDTNKTENINFEVVKDENVSQIAQKLFDAGLIKNKLVFETYNRLQKTAGNLKIGKYNLNQAMSVPEIVKKLLVAPVEQMKIMFFPGATLNFRHSERDKTPSHREVLKQAGFSDQQIDQAFAKKYPDHALFRLLPEATNLEGLIFGETLFFDKNSSVEMILRRYFDHFYKIVTENKLAEKYQAQGLSLYQGIILASIIEREAKTDSDRAQVAQVFLKRFRSGMKLGSDVTYQYICRKTGVPHNYNIDSPYNTRRYEGLPPAPISSPSQSSLLALAKPAEGDYVYFLAGDDGKTYFAHTYAEHESNIRDHCKIGCSVQ